MKTQRRATLTDVAREAGVSLKTASRVINNVTTVDESLRAKVVLAARKLGFRPHKGAASMRSGNSNMVGLVVRDICNGFYSSLAAGAAEVAEAEECLVIACSSQDSPRRQRQLVDAIFSQRPKGLLITPVADSMEFLRYEIELGTPVVAIDEPVVGVDVDTVAFDNIGATRAAVAIAVEERQGDLAVLTQSDSIASMPKRAEGARQALEAAGRSWRPNYYRNNLASIDEAREATAQLLSLADPPEIIFCGNNICALGAALQVEESQQSVVIVSFDDYPLSSVAKSTTVVIGHDDQEMGRVAARQLFDRATHLDAPARFIEMPTEIKVYRR